MRIRTKPRYKVVPRLTSKDIKRLQSLRGIAEECSDDSERQVGVLLVPKKGKQIKVANELPLGIAYAPYRVARPNKYDYIEHAERTAIAEAARLGIATEGASLYMSWYPCLDCVKAIINAGIRKLYCQPHTPPFGEKTRYNFDKARELLSESNILIIPWKYEDIE